MRSAYELLNFAGSLVFLAIQFILACSFVNGVSARVFQRFLPFCKNQISQVPILQVQLAIVLLSLLVNTSIATTTFFSDPNSQLQACNISVKAGIVCLHLAAFAVYQFLLQRAYTVNITDKYEKFVKALKMANFLMILFIPVSVFSIHGSFDAMGDGSVVYCAANVGGRWIFSFGLLDVTLNFAYFLLFSLPLKELISENESQDDGSKARREKYEFVVKKSLITCLATVLTSMISMTLFFFALGWGASMYVTISSFACLYATSLSWIFPCCGFKNLSEEDWEDGKNRSNSTKKRAIAKKLYKNDNIRESSVKKLLPQTSENNIAPSQETSQDGIPPRPTESSDSYSLSNTQ
jgi:hypothetical protein